MNKTLLKVTTALSPALSLALPLALSMAVSAPVMADNDRDYRYERHHDHERHHHHRHSHYARVVRVEPIYKIVRVAHEERYCRRDNHRERFEHRINVVSPGNILLGGLIGAVIGAAIAHDATAVYRPVERHSPRQPRACHTQIHYTNQQKLIAYNVTYRYHGRLYTTRMHDRPGERIKIDDDRHDRQNHHY
jgi:uncharacterized protein YcfJ